MEKEKFLKEAVLANDKSTVEKLLSEGAKAHYQDEITGRSVLMEAAFLGFKDIVEILLNKGAPWNALDREGKCAGEYAIENNNQECIDILFNFGLRAELILGSLENKIIEKYNFSSSNPLLQQPQHQQQHQQQHKQQEQDYTEYSEVIFTEDNNLMDVDKSHAIMMEWERPLMNIHAKLICSNIEQKQKITILNIGYGLGIIDSFIHENIKHNLNIEHHIIECHPSILLKAREFKNKYSTKENEIFIHEGKWQEVLKTEILEKNIKFDGVFYDTYGEYYRDMSIFHSKYLNKIMNINGIYSYFNGLCPRNIFFHSIYCEIVKLELQKYSFEVHFEGIDIEQIMKKKENSDDVQDEKTWKGVKDKYWFLETYYLPCCIFRKK